jgi:hypothetical protein
MVGVGEIEGNRDSATAKGSVTQWARQWVNATSIIVGQELQRIFE